MYYNRNDKEFIFIHIPKCGGTSIERSIIDGEHLEFERGCVHYFPRLKNNYPSIHPKHFKMYHYGKIMKEHLNDMFIFSMVRNPWDRMVSNYEYILRSPEIIFYDDKGNLRRDYEYKKTRIDFTSYIKDEFERVKFNHTNVITNSYEEYFVSKYRDGVDFVMKLENLAEDLPRLAGYLDMEIPLLHENKSKNREHYCNYYNADLKDKVYQKFKYEIHKYGYEF